MFAESSLAWIIIYLPSAINFQYFLTHCEVTQKVGLGPIRLPLKVSVKLSSSLTPVDNPCVIAWVAVLKLTCRKDHGHEWPEVVRSGLSGMIPLNQMCGAEVQPCHPSPSWAMLFTSFVVQTIFSQFLLCFLPATPLCTCHYRCCSLCPPYTSLTHVRHTHTTWNPNTKPRT